MTPSTRNAPQPEVQEAALASRLWTFAKIVLVLGAIVVASFFLVGAIVDVSIFEVHEHFIDNVKARLRLNSFLANALSLASLIPFGLGIKYYFFSFRNKQRRNTGLAILIAMGIMYNLVLYFGTRNENFGPDGKASRYYALVPGGVVFSDRAGTESKYGVPYRAVTPENVRWLNRIEIGRIESVADPARHDWFDRVTRDPLLWYYSDSNGKFYFFDGPGYAPSTGDQLQPVTPEVRRQWESNTRASATGLQRPTQREKIDSATSTPTRAGSVVPLLASETLNQPSAKTQRERRLEEFIPLLNTKVGLAAGKRNIAIMIASSGTMENMTPEQALYGHLQVEGAHIITNLFPQTLFTRGYFTDMYNGDPEMLRMATSSTRVDALILGRMNYGFAKGAAISNDLVSCEMALSCKVINQVGEVVKNDTFRVVGPGFSESAALERATELLATQFSERILRTIR